MTQGFALSALDITIIVVSLAIVTTVGLLVSRRQEQTAHGYFLASGRLRWWIIGTALIATSVSSEQIVGTMGAAYTYGMGIANWEWWTLPTYTIVMLFFIPVYLKSKVMTVPDYLTRRFGPLCGDIYSWVMLGAYVVIFMVTILYGGSLAFSALTGWNFYVVLWITVILVGLYTVKGGLASVVWTDMVQCLMLVGGGIFLFFVALSKVPGGWSAMMHADPQRFHLYHPASDPIAPFPALIFLALGLGPFYQGTNQVMVQRILGARSTWDGILGTIFAGFINFFRPMITVFPGFVAYYWVHHMNAAPLANADMTFPFVLKTVGPIWGFRGIVLTGFLAAVMSAISALANSTATIFALNIYKRSIRPQSTDRELVTAGRIAAFLALALAACLAPSVERLGGIFRYFQTGATYLATPFISVILLGLLWKRANYAGALFGILGGIVIQAVVATGVAMSGIQVHWLYTGFAAQLMTMTGVVIVSLRSAPPTKEQIESLVWRPALLNQYSGGVPRPWYKSLLLWFGVYATIWTYLYWRYW